MLYRRCSCIPIPTIFRQELAENKVQPQLEIIRHLRHSSVTAIQLCFRLHPQARTAFLTVRSATLQGAEIHKGFRVTLQLQKSAGVYTTTAISLSSISQTTADDNKTFRRRAEKASQCRCNVRTTVVVTEMRHFYLAEIPSVVRGCLTIQKPF